LGAARVQHNQDCRCAGYQYVCRRYRWWPTPTFHPASPLATAVVA
jgi:hypothetical protein